MHNLLTDIGISVIAATVLGTLAHFLRQPVILGYLVAGALIGPQIGFGWVSEAESIETISEIGLVLLLFIIGLEMDLRKIRASGKQLLVAGVGQFVLCVLLGLICFWAIGYGLSGGDIRGLYLSLLCALSSTAIVVKLLYDKFELDTLPGRITLGILVIQDLWAILILAFQPDFAHPQLVLFLTALAKSLVLLAAGFLLSRFVLKFVLESVAKSPEMVVAISLTWCAFMSAGAGMIGLSREMGALIAGISVSSFPFSIHVTAKTLPLRDFFLTLFFVSLGMTVPMPSASMLGVAACLVLFVIVSRFLTVYPLLSLSGAGPRTSFIASVNLSQISEFSLVIASLGVAYGHIQSDTTAVVVYAMALAAVLSSYMIKYNHELFLWAQRGMSRLGLKRAGLDEKDEARHRAYPVIVLGYHRGARSFIDVLAARNPGILRDILVVDFNPEILKELRGKNVAGLFGDIGSADTLHHARIEEARVILSTIPDMLLKKIDNMRLVKMCRELAPAALIVATAESPEQVQPLKVSGADEVILPYTMAGEFLADFMERVETDRAGREAS